MKKILAVLVVFAATYAHADIKQVETDLDQCLSNAESTADQNQCADKGYKAADAELNKVFAQIKLQLQKKTSSKDEAKDNAEMLKRLTNSEKAWIPFRDANCQLQGVTMLGGSGEGPVVGGCLAQTTIDRVKELQSIFASDDK